MSHNKRGRTVGDHAESAPPRKRFKSHHDHGYSNYHNHNHSRHLDMGMDVNASMHSSDSNSEDEHNSEQQNIVILQRAMSQVVYQNREDVEFEFEQCLRLYGMASSPNRTQIAKKKTSATSLSQPVSGANARRRHKESQRHRFIKRSQNNPWDRKMIDFLQNIPAVLKISQHYQERNVDEDQHVQTEAEFEAPSATDWINASIAVDMCAAVYQHRVDDLRRRVQQFICKTVSNLDRASHESTQPSPEGRVHRTQRRHTSTTADSRKLDSDAQHMEANACIKYEMDRLQIIRETGNSFLSSTHWWLDEFTPWIHEEDDVEQDETVDFCHEIVLNFDVSSSDIMDFTAFNFLTGAQNEHDELSCEEHHAEEKAIMDDDSSTVMRLLLPDIMVDMTDVLDDIGVLDVDIDLATPIHARHRNHGLLSMQTTPMTDLMPPIIGSVIQVSRRAAGSQSESSEIYSPIQPQRARKPTPLRNRRVCAAHAIVVDSDDEHEQRESQNTNPTMSSIAYFRLPPLQRFTHNVQHSHFRLPPLRRFTRQNCDMSTMINSLIDEDNMDDFIIDRHASNQPNYRDGYSPNKRRARKKRKHAQSGTTSKKQKTNHNHHRSPCPDADAVTQSPNEHVSVRITPTLPRDMHSLDEDGVSSIEFPRGGGRGVLSDDGVGYEHRMPAFVPFPGPHPVPDEYNMQSSQAAGSMVSTPRTSVSATLILPHTDPEQMALIDTDSDRRKRSKTQSALHGLPEMDEDININLEVQFEEHLSLSPRLPAQVCRKGRNEFNRHLKPFENIKQLNRCTYNILNDRASAIDRQPHRNSKLTFAQLLQSQRERLCDRELSVAMSFLSLLTVSSDSYHGRTADHDFNLQVELHRDEDESQAVVMGDFNIDLELQFDSE